MQELDTEVAGDFAQVVVVRHRQQDVGIEVAHAPPRQQVVEAVRQLAHEQRDPRAVVGEAQRVRHAEPRPHRLEGLGDFFPRQLEPVELPLDSLEEDAALDVGVLVGVDDVAVVAGDEFGHLRHEALLVAAAQEEHRGDVVFDVRIDAIIVPKQ